jgi:predicted O-linked N-acetylglucosamine transferase (SPINDLY family)
MQHLRRADADLGDRAVVQRKPFDPAAQLQQALALHQQGRLSQAESLYRGVLELAPDNFDALHLLGVVELQRGNPHEGLRLIGRALELNPNDPAAHLNLGNALMDLKRPEEALASYDRALALRPDYVDALTNRGGALRQLKRFEEALAAYDRALASMPDLSIAWNNRGNVLQDLHRPEEALASYDRALAFLPDYAEALNHRGNALRALKRPEEALASFRRALALRPEYADALTSSGDTLLELLRPNEAAEAFAQLLEVKPDSDYARGNLLYSRMQCCDWATFHPELAAVEREVREGKRAATPFAFQAMSQSPENLHLCSKTYSADRYPQQSPLWNGERYGNPRIRLGYLCGEFRTHATSMLMAGLFESHDRKRFELFAFDNGYDDGTPLRGRVEKAFDAFVDISRASDLDAARLIRERQIDILVNLNGYCGLSRTGVFAYRPCPVQVNYLGFPGTMGAEYMDYIVADRVVIPEDEERYYSEKVVILSDCYQVNDSKRGVAEAAPTRKDAGLPESGFVFCCFNNNHKITPVVFDVWMRLLGKVEGSVLWLIQDNAVVAGNLHCEAQRRGIAPERLVFARRVSAAEHLARHRLADLFLDTLPYNAHTTCSDALWAGLPVLTCMGTAFPGRVAASLLYAADLPELVTQTLEEYEVLALRLATNPSTLSELKTRVAGNRATSRLFNTDRFRRHIESAYITMWERAEGGEPPVAFVVEPTGGERGRSGILLST